MKFKKYFLVLWVLVTIVLLGGVAWAWQGTTPYTIKACVDDKGKVDQLGYDVTCDPDKETEIIWGIQGPAGTSCTVTQNNGSATISCNDSTSATVNDGADGADGADGTNGVDGAEGLSCWDLNGNRVPDLPAEDTNGDNDVNVHDCRGLQTAGGGQPHENRQPYWTARCIIALTGTFPSRNFADASDPGKMTTGLASPLLSSEPFIGEISWFAGNFPPRGWAFCDGQLLAINQHQSLYSLLGTTYGGDGRTTFALPDARGRVLIHAGSGPGLTTYRQGDKGGAETVTLTESQMPAHDHNPVP